MKIGKVFLIISNIVLCIFNLFLLVIFGVAAFSNEKVEYISKADQNQIFFGGVFISILLIIIVNYLIVKILNNKTSKLKILKVSIIPIIITGIEAVFVFVS